MPELSDRLPGEVILSAYANDIRDRTGAGQRYLNLAAIIASNPIPTAGDSGYLSEEPWAVLGDELGSGHPVVWREANDSTDPRGPGFIWSESLHDVGGNMFGGLFFRGSGATPSDPAWRMDTSGGDNFRIRSINHPDAQGEETWLQFSGSASGGTSFLRLPNQGFFAIRDRTTNTARVRIGPDITANDAPINSARAEFGMMLALQTGTDAPAVLSSGDLNAGPVSAILTRASTVGANVAVTDPDGDSNIDGIFWLPSQDLFSTEEWTGSSLWNMSNGRQAHRLDRYTGSLAAKKKLRTKIGRNIGARAASLVANAGPLLTAIDDLDVELFQFKVDGIDAGDPAQGQFVPGFIADDLHAIDPRLCSFEWEVDENGARVGDPILRGVNKNVILPLAVLRIQELTERIEALENP